MKIFRHIQALFFLLALMNITDKCTAQGIEFEQGDWQSVKEKANKAHKLIYIDVYTTWCAPCKLMAKKYFPEKEREILTIIAL